MEFKQYYIVANTRDEFTNESEQSSQPYNDHPSRESIKFIINELTKEGFNAKFFGGVKELIDAYQQHLVFTDTLFLNFSDGLNQNSRKAQTAILLELLNVPYVGSEPLSYLMAGNKAYTKKIISPKISVPKGLIIFKNDPLPVLKDINFPVIIKPNKEGSSIGITQKSICHNIKELYRYLPVLLAHFKEVLIEEYIAGYEITCFIIGNKGDYYLIEPILCEYKNIRYFENFVFGLEEKSNRVRKEYLARNILDIEQIDKICRISKEVFELLNMNDFARIDFRLTKENQLVFIEINGNAVISETSELGVISRELKIPFGKIVGNIIHTATKRLSANHD